MKTLHVKKDDIVEILSGKDAGKKGKILKSFPKLGMVLVEGMNVKKFHQKPTKKTKGQTVEKSLPINVSKVKLSK